MQAQGTQQALSLTRSRLLLSWGNDCANSPLGMACRLAASCSASFLAAWAAREALITLLAPAATMLFTYSQRW